jgi:hypothetical protein
MWASADGFALEDIGLQAPGERSTEASCWKSNIRGNAMTSP